MTDDHAFPDREHAAERYLLGEMSDADRERYEEHIFGCPECADDVRMTAVFLDDVRTHVAPPAPASRGPARVVALDHPKTRRPVLSFFWPLPSGAAVAATLLAAVIGYQAFAAAGLRRALAEEQAIQSVPSSFLAVSRSEGPIIPVSARQKKITLRFSDAFGKVFPFYRCEIRDAFGRVVISAVLETSGDELQIQVSSNLLTDGAYTVTIAGLETETATTSPLEAAVYHFTLRRQP